MSKLDIQRVNIQRVKNATHFSRQHLDGFILSAEAAYTDRERTKRIAAQLCRWCFYGRSASVAGQAFTTRDCESCGEQQTYSSTATNPLCMSCAQRYGLCVSCCADVDLTNRTKVERHAPPKKRRSP